MSNATLFGDSNVTNNDTDDYAEPDPTTQTPGSSSSSTVRPALIPGPLPLSGRLPTPATNGTSSF